MRIASVLLICILMADAASAQQEWPLQVALSSNATSLPPGMLTRLFTDPLHPGITLGTEYSYRKKRRHEWFQTARLGYFYHRENQHAIQLYTELGYRRRMTPYLDMGLLIGGGYHHSIRDEQFLQRNSNGTYEKFRTDSSFLQWLPERNVSLAMFANKGLSRGGSLTSLYYDFYFELYDTILE